MKRVPIVAILSLLLAASAQGATTVTLGWSPSPCTNVITNYTVYYGAASGTYTNTVDAGTNLDASVTNLVTGRAYYFAATEVDDEGQESDYSEEASIEPPVVTVQPQDAWVRIGHAATFSVGASGSEPLGYQWVLAGTNMEGATSAVWSYTVNVAQTNILHCVVSNWMGEVASSGVWLYATGAAPVITSQPVSRSVVIGNPAPFSVVATGDGTLSYQWSLQGVEVSGATGASWTYVPAVAGTNVVWCRVTSEHGQVTSSGVYLYATGVPAGISGQPANQWVNVGSTATFSVSASGTAPLSYQWARGGTNVAGATGSSWSYTPLTSQTNAVRCAVTNPWGQLTSSNAFLYAVGVAPSITGQPQARTVLVGTAATFNVGAAGTAPLSYQWTVDGVNAAGATSVSWTYVPSAAGVMDVRCAVTNLYGAALSASAVLTATNVVTTNETLYIRIPWWAKRIMFTQ